MLKYLSIASLSLILIGCNNGSLDDNATTTGGSSNAYSYVQKGKLASSYNQAFFCVDGLYQRYYSLYLDKQNQAVVPETDQGAYSTQNNQIALNLPNLYQGQYTQEFHATMGNNLLFFSGFVDNAPVGCVAGAHDIGTKVDNTVISCRKVSSGSGYSSESFYTFTLYSDGSSSYQYKSNDYSGGITGDLSLNDNSTSYGSYYYNQSKNAFALVYLSLDTDDYTNDINIFSGEFTSSGANVEFGSATVRCSVE